MVCINYLFPCSLNSGCRTIDNTPITSIVADLCDLGFAVAEVEYRRRDDEGGGERTILGDEEDEEQED